MVLKQFKRRQKVKLSNSNHVKIKNDVKRTTNRIETNKRNKTMKIDTRYEGISILTQHQKSACDQGFPHMRT